VSPQELPATLFVGKASSGICWYRCTLPAMALGLDWVSVAGDPPEVAVRSGLTKRPVSLADLARYDVVVLQQPFGAGWKPVIRELQAAGTTVLFEIDDYVHAVRKMDSHELQKYFTRELLASAECNMRLADGVICSTTYLARQYASFNQRIWVCRNGLDLARYDLEPPPRTGVTIGWAGGIGHKASLARWEPAVREVLRKRDEARFVSVGYGAAAEYLEEFGPQRAIGLPSGKIEVYPASMTTFDIAIAPSSESNLFKGKSDLRWLESSALGIPLVAHPETYSGIEDGVTGVHARTPKEVEAALLDLVDDREKRERIGAQAYAHVAEHRRIERAAERWREVLLEVAPVKA
jgi:glycosyltransferase involved in cell wall biosynthesis